MEGDDPAGRALSQLVKDLQRAEAERGRTKPKVDYDAYRAQYKKRLAELDEEEQRGKSRRRRSITVSSIQPQPWQARDHAKHKQMRAEEETKLPEPKSDQITLPEQSHTAKTFPMVDSPPNVAASPPKQDMRSSRDTSQRGRDTSRTQDTGDTQRGDTLGKKTERKRGTEKGEQQTMFETPPPVKQATTTLKDKIFHTVDSIIRRHDHSDKDKSSSVSNCACTHTHMCSLDGCTHTCMDGWMHTHVYVVATG